MIHFIVNEWRKEHCSLKPAGKKLYATAVDCEQSLFCSKIPAGGAARKRVRYSSHATRRSQRVARGLWLAARGSRLEYRIRFLAAPPAGILVQKRDCSQSTTAGEECYEISSDGSVLCEGLRYTQEEVDTRLLLHTYHAGRNGCATVVISSDDTDVFLLCLAFKSLIPSTVYMKRNTGPNKVYRYQPCCSAPRFRAVQMSSRVTRFYLS